MGKSTSNITPIANAQRRAGIGAADRRKVAEKLSEVLEGVYSLLLRTQMVHWNVRGASFHGVHILTEQQYKTLFEAIDIIAERILSLGFGVPAKNGAIIAPTSAPFDPKETADGMLERLAAEHEACARTARETAEIADEADDLVTADMLTDRLAEHEKAIWMLRSQMSRQ